VNTTDDEQAVIESAKETIADQLSGKTIVKELYVRGRLVNIVAK
jgi:leucyl-tRNA synthetase